MRLGSAGRCWNIAAVVEDVDYSRSIIISPFNELVRKNVHVNQMAAERGCRGSVGNVTIRSREHCEDVEQTSAME